MTTSESPPQSTNSYYWLRMADVVSAVVLLGTAKGLQSITITRLGTSEAFSVSSATSGCLELELLKSLSKLPRTSAIPLPGAHSAATS